MASASGNFTPTMLILKGSSTEPDPLHFQVYDFEDTTRLFQYALAASDNGWLSFKILYEFLCNSFNRWLTENEVQRPFIVFSNWHEKRSNLYLAQRLTDLGIYLITFVSNTTHFSLTLDLAVFRPMKKKWSAYYAQA